MEQLLDIGQVCERLQVKESTVRSWVFQRRIPVVRMGRLVRFRPSEIERWLEDQDSKRPRRATA